MVEFREDSWKLMTLCLLTTVVALLLVLSIHLHQDVKYWKVSDPRPSAARPASSAPLTTFPANVAR